MNAQLEINPSTYTVIALEQGTEEWHQWRANGIGASSMPALMGESPYQTPLQFWREKVGLDAPKDLSRNPHVQRGVNNEEPARQAFDALYGEFTMPLCVEGVKSHYRVSLDGLTADGLVLEIKCPTAAKAQAAIAWVMDNELAAEKQPVTRKVLESLGLYYWAQVQYQLAVLGSPKAVLWVWDVETETGARFDILADAEYQAELLAKADWMWECITTFTAPSATDADQYHPEVGGLFDEAERAYIARAAEMAALDAQLKALKKEQDALLEGMIGMADGRKSIVGNAGLKITSFYRKGTVDYAALLADIAPDLPEYVTEGFRKKGSESVKVTLPK